MFTIEIVIAPRRWEKPRHCIKINRVTFFHIQYNNHFYIYCQIRNMNRVYKRTLKVRRNQTKDAVTKSVLKRIFCRLEPKGFAEWNIAKKTSACQTFRNVICINEFYIRANGSKTTAHNAYWKNIKTKQTTDFKALFMYLHAYLLFHLLQMII